MPSYIDWSVVPDVAVAKPVYGKNARGVILLARHGDRWIDIRSKEEHVRPESFFDRPDTQIVVDEAIGGGGSLPHDWKLFSFRGEVGLIMQIDRSGTSRRYSYYSPEWKVLHNPRPQRRGDTSLPPPRFPRSLVETARTLSLEVEVPFVRIDLFEDSDGVVFGEFSPFPGGPLKFRQPIDRQLGTMWEAAQGRLWDTNRSEPGGP